MTRAQIRLAIADTGFVAFWLLMNFFWMWSMYAVAIPLAAPTALAALAMFAWTERKTTTLCITGSNVGWFLKDFFWMMENSGRMPSGLWWGTLCFAVTLGCAVASLVAGGFSGTLADALERLKRIRLLVLRK